MRLENCDVEPSSLVSRSAPGGLRRLRAGCPFRLGSAGSFALQQGSLRASAAYAGSGRVYDRVSRHYGVARRPVPAARLACVDGPRSSRVSPIDGWRQPMRYAIRLLSQNELVHWDDFVRESENGLVFSMMSYLRHLERVEVLGAFQGDDLVAGFPVPIVESAGKLRIHRSSYLSPYFG